MKKILQFLAFFFFLMSASIFAGAQTQQQLSLAYACSDNPASQWRWKVTNPNSFPVTYTWKMVNAGNNAPSSSQYPYPFIAQPGINYFFSPKYNQGNNNMMAIYVNNVEQANGRKAPGNSTCETMHIFVDCVKKLDDCTYQASFGYENLNTNTNFIRPHTNDNKITGATVFRGETDTIFYPGMHHNAFKIRFSCPGTIVWTLKGVFGNKTVNTSSSSVGTCIDPVKVFVKHIYSLSNGNHRAVFGYENFGVDTVIIADTSRNYFTGSVIQAFRTTVFIPGKKDSAFYADFSGSKLTWNLTSYDDVARWATADIIYTGMELKPMRVFVNKVVINGPTNATVTFGYENYYNNTLVIAKGSRNRLIWENTGYLPATVFLPGKKDSAFIAQFSGSEMKWALVSPDGVEHYAVANRNLCTNGNGNNGNNNGEHGNGNHRYILSPNPAADILNIQVAIDFLATDLPTEISVHDLTGKKIITHNFSPDEPVQIDLSKLVGGVYFLKSNNGSYSEIERFVKL